MISLSSQAFGSMLLTKLESTTDIVTLSRWANEMYLANIRRLEPGVKDMLQRLRIMEDSIEFEYSIEELISIAKKMVSGEV